VQKFLSVIQNDVFLLPEVMLVMCILRFQLREKAGKLAISIEVSRMCIKSLIWIWSTHL